MTKLKNKQRLFRLLLLVLLSVFAAGLGYAVLNLPLEAPGLSSKVAENLDASGVSNPDIWNSLAHMVPVFIVSLGLGLALLTTAISWLVDKVPSLHMQEKQSDNSQLWFERWSGKIVAQGRVTGLDTLPRLRARCLATAESCLQIHAWKKALQTGEFTLQRWALAITLLLLVGMTVVLLLLTG